MKLTPRRAALLAGALALVVALPTLRNRFAIDDVYLIVDNPAVHRLGNVPSLFRQAWGNGAGGEPMYTRVNAASFRPVTSTLFSVEYALFGAHPAWFHLLSALLHALATALVTLLAFALLRSSPGALVAGVLFAVHPVHSEVIAAVTYQTTLLEALFSLAALLLFGRILERQGRARAVELALLSLLPLLAFLSKEESVMLPLLALAWALILRPPGWRRALVVVAVMALSTALALLWRASIVVPSGITYFGSAPRSTVIMTMLGTLALDLELLVAPFRLCVFYDWFIVPFQTTLTPEVLTGALVALAFLLAFVVSLRRAPIVAVALAWTALPLAVVLQLVPILNVAAERFLYLPSVGLVIVVGWLTLRARTRRARAAAFAAVGVAAALFAARTLTRLPDWRDDRTLNEATARDFPETPTPLVNLARLDEREGRIDRARADLEEALRRAPGYPPVIDRLRELDQKR